MIYAPIDTGSMLTELYIEALLVDEELADLVWELWNRGEFDDELAGNAWWLIPSYPRLEKVPGTKKASACQPLMSR